MAEGTHVSVNIETVQTHHKGSGQMEDTYYQLGCKITDLNDKLLSMNTQTEKQNAYIDSIERELFSLRELVKNNENLSSSWSNTGVYKRKKSENTVSKEEHEYLEKKLSEKECEIAALQTKTHKDTKTMINDMDIWRKMCIKFRWIIF